MPVPIRLISGSDISAIAHLVLVAMVVITGLLLMHAQAQLNMDVLGEPDAIQMLAQDPRHNIALAHLLHAMVLYLMALGQHMRLVPQPKNVQLAVIHVFRHVVEIALRVLDLAVMPPEIIGLLRMYVIQQLNMAVPGEPAVIQMLVQDP